MDIKLPKYIASSIRKKNTSLGDHPSFPPDDEEMFLLRLINKHFIKSNDKHNIGDIKEAKETVGKLLAKCQKIEADNKSALEKLAIKVANDIFAIPEDTIDIEAKLVPSIDIKVQRLFPEETDGFEFDSIDDMNNLGDEIYKRRMLNVLVNGASQYCILNYDAYIADLFRISPELPSLYIKINDYNSILIYYEKDTIDTNSVTVAGNVDIHIQQNANKVRIIAQGIIFPSLLGELIKGFNELAISHGLPEKRDKAEYILKKSDFALAELWDTRLGMPLWECILNMLKKIDYDIDEVGLNFFFMELSRLSPYDFNNLLKELFAGTKRGEVLLKKIVDTIISNKEQDEFDNYMRVKRQQKYQLSDSEYFKPDELITDCL